MKRGLLVGVLGVLLVGLVAASGVGWWWLKQNETPYLFETVHYGLTPNWYLGEFQPMYLYQFSRDEATYLKVLYRKPYGKLAVGEVLVGGRVNNQDLPLAPWIKAGETSQAESEADGFRYPLYPGQRFKVTFLLHRTGAKVDELEKLCEQSQRLCQLGRVVFARGEDAPLAVGGVTPISWTGSDLGSWGTNITSFVPVG